MSPISVFRNFLFTICLVLLAASPTNAEEAIWDGGGTDGNWGNTGGTSNWQSGAVPTFNPDLNVIFNTPGAGNLLNFIGTSRTIGSLTFNSDARSSITIRPSVFGTGAGIVSLTLGSTSILPTITVMPGDVTANVIHNIGAASGMVILGNDLTIINHTNPIGSTARILQISVPVNGSFGITKAGTGQLYLSHANNLYTGKTVVNGGYLRIAGADSIGPNPASFIADQLILNGGTLYIPAVTGGTTVNLLNRGITLGEAGGGFIMNSSGTARLVGQISGSGNLTLLGFSTPGTLILPQANTYTGQTIINSSILSLTSALALQNSPLNTSSSTFGTPNRGLRTNQANLNLGGLIGDKDLASIFTTSTGGYGGVSALTLNTASGAEHHYSAIITDGAAGMSLTKTGEGTQILSGANLYSGSTTISNGTLAINSPFALPTTTSLVLAGGKLDLKGQSAVVQALNVIAAGSVIDFGAIEGGNTLQIINGALAGWTGSLVILHFDRATDALFFGSNAAGIIGNAEKIIFRNPIGLPEGDYVLIPGTDGAALLDASPSITTQPASQTITSGSTATLTVTVIGTEPFTYQWYQGISGDTTSPVGTNSSAFTTPALTASTSYWVKISNSEGSVDSAMAIITTPFVNANKVTFNGVGTTNWICPPGVTSIQVECWGGGGAGGAGTKEISTGTNTSQNGGGGGGGAYARRVAVPVTPGNSYAINIPDAAVSGTNGTTTNGGGRVNGSDVTFVGDGGVTVTAAGGEGGANAYITINTTVGALAGAGGTSAASLGDLGGVFEGGGGSPGNTGPTNVSGSGGGGAGDAATGGSGFTSTSSPYVGAGAGGITGGGAGGIGRTGDPPTSGNTNEGAGTPGSTPGGGGGGAKNQGDGFWPGGTGGLGQIIITCESPTIGYPGNPADPTTGHGAVDYSYKIGRYEVTNTQYAEFLNSVDPTGSNPYGIYNTEMGNNIRGGISYNSGAANGSKYSVKANMGNKPVVYVSWFDAARFTNWLHNGQGIGSTENGAYLLNGATSGTNFTREAGATVWIPNNNEWHKAAYYDPTPGAGGGDNYWFYPTQSDSTPTVATANTVGDVSNPGANVANYNYGADWNGLDGNLTTVGSAAANNYFGTADQAGNAREWTEGLTGNGTGRLYRGGGFNVEELAMQSTRLVGPNPTTEGSNLGFRVASLDQPDALILEFGLPGQPALINHTEGIIIWNVPEGTNVASLAPIYTVSPLAIEDPANPSGSSRDFTTAQTYTITSQNGGSRVYSVITGTPPTITTQPANQSISSGSTATLTVVATGSPAPTYQWYQGISGDTTTPVGTNSASFTTPALTNTTNYWVKVSNAAYPTGVNSAAATITVHLPDLAVEIDGPLTAAVGDEFEYLITVRNLGLAATPASDLIFILPENLEILSYQFPGEDEFEILPPVLGFFGFVEIAPLAAESSAVVRIRVKIPIEAGGSTALAECWIDPRDPITEVDGANNYVNLLTTIAPPPAIPPTITTQPANQTITSGAAATITVVATGSEPLTYQWYQGISGDTSTPVGTNSASFTTPSLTSTNSYWVKVSNSEGTVNSETATIWMNLLVNGSFEQPIVDGGLLLVSATDSTTLTGWTVLQGSIDVIRTIWNASEGLQSLDVSGSSAGTIYQDVENLIPGATYRIQFDLSGNPGSKPGDLFKRLLVSAAGQSNEFEFDITPATLENMAWEMRQMEFVASSTTARIQFESLSPGLGGPALDNVSLVRLSLPPNFSPIITEQPASQTIASGTTATLTVTAIGSEPINYQWYQGVSGDTTTPVGANSASFTTPPLISTQPIGNGSESLLTQPLTANASFWVRVSNSTGFVDSDTATVTISDITLAPGLRLTTYDDTWGLENLIPISNLAAVTPSGQAVQIDNINYSGGSFETPDLPGLTDVDNFSILWQGWFDVSKDGAGEYTFGTSSDDGSVIFIDLNNDGDFADPGELILDNNFLQPATARVGTVNLPEGKVLIAIGYFEQQFSYGMEARFSKGSGLTYENLNPINGTSGHFFHEPASLVQAPVIDTHPVSQEIAIGTSATLSVTASGVGPFTYQWYQGASGDLSTPVGTNSATFNTGALSADTSFWVRVSNYAGAVDSETAAVTIIVPPTPEIVVEEPIGQSLGSGASRDFGEAVVGAVGQARTFKIRNQGNAPLENISVSIIGFRAVNFTLNASILPSTLDPGEDADVVVTFQPQLSGGALFTQLRILSNDTTASPFVVSLTGTAWSAPSITTQPLASQSIIYGAAVTLNVSVSALPAATYQWYQGLSGNTSQPIGGAQLSNFTTPSLISSTSYWVRASNAYGAVDSNTAFIEVEPISNNASLGFLATNQGTLVPAFNPAITNYQLMLASTTESLLVLPIVAHPAATITVNGLTVESGDLSTPIPLVVGDNLISVVVTAQDGETTRTYQITAKRREPMFATTGAATGITQNEATLNGTAIPNGAANVRFQYGTSTAYGNLTPIIAVDSAGPVDVQSLISNLQGGTRYHYRLMADNGVEVVYGLDQNFETLPGAPLVVTGNPVGVTTANATLVGAVDGRGLETRVKFEYGLTNLLGTTTDEQVRPAGTGYQDVLIPISGLTPNAQYYVRLVATSASGTRNGDIRTFQATATGGGTGSPTAAPEVTTGIAVSITTNSAELRGTVDAKGGVTITYVEFGTTASLGFSSTPVSIGDVDNEADVSLPISGLNPGTEYHYRIVGQNSIGKTEGTISTFRTNFLPPVVNTGTATVLTTTSVQVAGTVRASGDVAAARFRYGTNPGNLDLLVDALPMSVTGNSDVPIVATLPNLNQGTRYYYRAEAENSGGLRSGSILPFDVAVLSGLDRRFPDFIDTASHQGSLRVDLLPAGIGGWRFAGETTWREAGSTATGLADGDRRIEFRPATGHVSPATETLTVVSALGLQVIEKTYFPSAAPGSGTLRVLLKPESIISESRLPADRAQWRLAGEIIWRDSTDEATGLIPGNYIIEMKPLAGYETPSSALAVVVDGQTTLSTVTYYLAADPVGVAASPVPFATVSNNSSQPFGFVGQILSDVGAASGFVVKSRVVATAGHVVFDDGTLAASTGLKWLFQRDVGVHEPMPITPRGFYLLSGYAAQRAIDNSPGVSSPDSQNLDAAAVYFADDAVGRNGYSGFLASDLPENEFLISNLDKTLVGYPVEAVLAADIGKMHATPAANVEFSQSYLRTYATDDIRGSGGMSGGPLFVRNSNNVWYPAAIFLGGTRQTIVRAIDSDVANLFGFAEASAVAVGGSTGGSGVLGASSPIDTPDLGALRVVIEPAAARNAGARWRINSGAAYQLSGAQLVNLTPNTYTVHLSTVPGFLPPTPHPVTVVGGELLPLTFTYEEIILPPVITSPASVTLVRGQTLDYQITTQPAADAFSLFGALPTGVDFNASTGRITGIPQSAGVFVLQAGATNSGGSGTKTITLTSLPILANQSATATRGEAFSHPLTSGESGDVIWSATNLPDGLSINPATGLISGVPVFAGSYTPTISITVNGSTASAILNLTILGDSPVFTLEPPATRVIEFGTSTTFIVTTTGQPAPTYQWYRGSSGNIANPVTGATSATFTTPAITTPTSYWVRASNLSGSVDSSAVSITLTPSTNPELTGLDTNLGSLTPLFSPAVSLYRITVPHTATSITVRPTARVSQTTIAVNGTSSASGLFSAPVLLAVGVSRIEVLTTAGDGVTTRAYAIDVTRLPAPTVVTDPATQVGFQNVQLNGRVTPNGPGQAYFEYGLTDTYGQQTPRQSVSGDTQLQVNRPLGGLAPETAYHFRLVLENSLGKFNGINQQFFTAPRPPTVATGTVFNSTSAQALLPGAVNPNALPVSVWFEYGLSPALGASTLTFEPVPNGGTSAVDVSFLLTGLLANNVYYYRLVAQSDAGISHGRIETFVATNSAGTSDGIADSPPTVATSEVDDATTTTATLRGTVIPNDGSTEAWFEYGTTEALGTETSPQLIGNGNQLRNVTAPIEGLEPDVRYYFRIVGRNSEDKSYGQIRTFDTIFNPPVVTIATVEALSSTSVRITGSVDPRGASADVDFLYGTDGTTFPLGVVALESPVAVNEGNVSAVLINLQPSVTYHAVIKAVSVGGPSQSEILTFQPGALMGLVQELPQPVLSSERIGETRVDILPTGVGAWRFTGETQWRQPGAVATGLTTADRVIEFMPVIGYNRPPDEPVSVISGGDMVVVEAIYYPAAEPGLAALTVNIEPSLISDPARPESSRAQWRFVGMTGDPWKDSGATVSELPAGTYIVECKPLAGRQTPTPRNITLGANEARSVTYTYFAATAPMLNPPSPVSYQTAISNPALPNAYVGQVRGDVGSYSGFAVKRRVVATTAQAVFDDATLTFAGNLEWLWLPDRQEHVPKPIKPLGVYVFKGYASQRTSEASPGTLSNASLNLNIAALYFSEDTARGGASGFLASDSLANPHLVSAKSKILSGYPTVGISPANLGRLHATNPSAASFTWLTGMSFDSSAIRGFGGMAGGPLSVRQDEGAYYPAGIYVGGTNRGVVRAIDTEVIDLFSRAETSANGGDNNVSGGITLTSFTTISTSTTVGAVRVVILPSAAVDASAGWRLSTTSSYRTSGNQLNNLTPGSYFLYLRPVTGFPDPPVGQIVVEVGKRTDITFDYSALNSPPSISAISAQVIAEDQSTGPLSFVISDGELDITRSSSNTALVPNTNIVIDGTGLNRTVTVTPAANQFGVAVITLTVSDGPLTASTQFTLTVNPVNDPPTISFISNQTLAVGTTSTPIGFTISDLETATSLLTPLPASSNPSLLPTSAVQLGGSGANRTITLSPLSGQLGSTTVTVTLSDGGLSASREFILTVTGTALETWRFANFSSTNVTGDAADNVDYDGDGATNIEEYSAGTDPKNSLDVFRVISSSQSGNTFSVVIPGKPGRDYTLQRSPTLSGPWQNITSSGVLVDQREVTLNDNARLPERGFYRVATNPNP